MGLEEHDVQNKTVLFYFIIFLRPFLNEVHI